MALGIRLLRQCAVVLAAVALAALARAVLHPYLGSMSPFITFFPAVALAAWYGGAGFGLLGMFLSYALAEWLFTLPDYAWGRSTVGNKVAQLVIFLAMSGFIVGLIAAMRRASARAARGALEAARSARLMEVTLQSIGDAVIATDAASRITFMNPVAERLTAWTAAAAAGRPLPEIFVIVHEGTREPAEDPCAKALRTGTVVGLANHTVLIARDGTERPIDDSAAPILDHAGEIHGAIIVFRDATREREATLGLQRLAAIVEDSDDAIVSKTIGGVITSWNAAAERLFGYAAEEAIGRHISLIVPQERRAEHAAVLARLAKGERIQHWDTVRCHRNGTLIPVSLQISPIRDAEGDIVGASKVARDITVRKRAEEALEFLAAASATLSTLVDQASALQQAARAMVPGFADWCVIAVTREDGGLEQAVSAHRDRAKESRLQAMAECCPGIWSRLMDLPEATPTGTASLITSVPAGRVVGLAEDAEQAALLDGLAPVSFIGVPLRVRERATGFIGFALAESTHRYTLADARLAEDLARRIAIALDNARLVASIREADRQKDDFIAMLAHELRNPLAAIRYGMEAARLQGTNGGPTLFAMVERQVAALSRLIDDLLDVSRISRAKITLRRSAADTGELVRRAAETVRPLIAEFGHTLTLDVDPQPMPLHVDPTRIEQVVVNLLTNAAKFTPDGGRIALSARPRGEEVEIVVHDSGIGLEPAVLPQMFEAFTQVDHTLDRARGGLGIGLAVVRRLTEMHGGSVTAESAGLGHGATFTVRLPLAGAAEAAEAGAASETQAARRRLRVLLVDDNRDTVEAGAVLLQAHGHEVAVAYNGPGAIARAREHRPHAILLDIGLPDMSGYEVARALRAEGLNDACLIAVSGYGQEADRQRAREAGFDHHLVKPVDTQVLLALLATVEADPAVH